MWLNVCCFFRFECAGERDPRWPWNQRLHQQQLGCCGDPRAFLCPHLRRPRFLSLQAAVRSPAPVSSTRGMEPRFSSCCSRHPFGSHMKKKVAHFHESVSQVEFWSDLPQMWCWKSFPNRFMSVWVESEELHRKMRLTVHCSPLPRPPLLGHGSSLDTVAYKWGASKHDAILVDTF